MAIGKRYVGSPLPSGPSAGKAAAALGDPRGAATAIVRSNKKGSVNRRTVSKARARGKG